MKLFGFFVCLCVCACTSSYQGIPEKYHSLLNDAFSKADSNKEELQRALNSCPPEQKEGMAYLIAYMPEPDLKEVKAALLLNNVEYAYKAKVTFPWTRELPDSIFLNEVLPYACLNETREDWRGNFYNRFSKYVNHCENIGEAIDSVNRNIRDEVMVDYNTKREKPDQSPSESIRQGMASCSGLSILLADAFRAVGIPARVAGTPNWRDNRGNHNWCEVWAEGQWYFTEYYPNQLNKAWFLSDAGKADGKDPGHAIYASSYKPTGIYFPLVWDDTIRYVHAENVTGRYVDIYRQYENSVSSDGEHVAVKIMMFKTLQCTLNSDDRVEANVDIFCGQEQMGGCRTSGAMQDMNDTPVFMLEKNKTYTFKYAGSNGENKTIDVNVGEEPVDVRLYME